MSEYHIITPLENELKASVTLMPDSSNENVWKLKINLFYEGEAVGVSYFTLHGHSHEEALSVAKNIRKNPFIMKEIDEMLWG